MNSYTIVVIVVLAGISGAFSIFAVAFAAAGWHFSSKQYKEALASLIVGVSLVANVYLAVYEVSTANIEYVAFHTVAAVASFVLLFVAFYEMSFLRHEKNVHNLLTSIRDRLTSIQGTLEESEYKVDPLRPQKIHKVRDALRTALPAVADRIDDAFAASVLDSKYRASQLSLMLIRGGASLEESVRQSNLASDGFAKNLATSSTLKGISETSAHEAISKIFASSDF